MRVLQVLGMVNKCLITSILVFAYPGSPSQVLFSLIPEPETLNHGP